MIEDVRDWIAAVEELGELQRVEGCNWDAEMGPLVHLLDERLPDRSPAVLRAVPGSAALWEQLKAAGVPDVPGVWMHESGCAWRFVVVSIHQRYPGHARQALHAAAACSAAAYNGKWTIVVDDDIDPGDIRQVVWALATRFDPAVDVDLMRQAWSSGRDPMVLPGTGNFNNRILIDACIPYNRKLDGSFPSVVDLSAERRRDLEAKWGFLLDRRQSWPTSSG